MLLKSQRYALCLSLCCLDLFSLNSRTSRQVGAGIQVAPNQARILRRLGVLEDLEPSAVRLDKISLRRSFIFLFLRSSPLHTQSRSLTCGPFPLVGYKDNSVLGTAPLSSVPENYGAPIWVVHRADLQRVLRVGAEREGVKILCGHHCADVDFEQSKLLVKTSEGEEWVEGDVIIAADGIKSVMREKMLSLSGLKDEGEYYRYLYPDIRNKKLNGLREQVEQLETPLTESSSLVRSLKMILSYYN